MRVKEHGNYGEEWPAWNLLVGNIVMLEDGRIGAIYSIDERAQYVEIMLLPARGFRDIAKISLTAKLQILKNSWDILKEALSAYAESHAEFVRRDDEQ